MAYTYPAVADFKLYFVNDFPYGDDDGQVPDTEISRAMDEAKFNLNSAFASTQEQFNILFFYMTAHYLVMDIRAASQGSSGVYSWVESSKSVGSVTQGFSVPQRIMDSPSLAMLTNTMYGGKYLQLILPRIVGQILPICGSTRP